MISIEDLSLTSIDGIRHTTTSESIVAAVVFAAKLGHSTRTAYRFVTALVMVNALDDISQWEDVLRQVVTLEGEGA
jgi:hypothetical protein